ncbi:multicopper oxidase family protein [Streptomyces indicus]|uniref:Multicopper oxidase with three cupredoxin domains (Includes cell division protein FtsP and spore coat protein CotA) n=1 Tax=Streptomyces indicus TaxID=417292 RepID=A0A1G9ECR5_9ACTN|nr:multicopper oxidase domain-containing protein [Streptomyces indicus]SDK73883.1 Multicopper oxidase with three cupredoxin domains (includes cell division protein FtsP and spore coat protein CotA) [Streptomyces indicus]
MTTKGGGRGRLRRILITLGVVVGVLAAAVGGGFAWLWTGADVDTVGKEPFENRLAIPPLAKSRVEADGTRVFDLRMQAGEKEFKSGQRTRTWGFNGDYLGPTLRAGRGEKVKVRISNGLDEASTVHWHGMHLPARMDGGPHQMVEPGGTWSPRWTVDQPAATLWYHPHPHGATEKHVQRGLAGMFLLDDDKARKLPLPDDYGVDDLPVIVQDVRFDGAQFDHGHQLMRNTGFLGDRTMVNGTLNPYREVGDELVRLRLLNASTARVYDFGFSDDRRFSLIGTDGGLLAQPAAMDRVQLSPGERAEIVVRMKAGERTVLRSFPQDNYGDAWQTRFSGGDDSFDVLELRAKASLRPSPALPGHLAEPEVPDGTDSARSRFFGLRMSGINGRPMDMARIDEVVTRGTAETWTVRNEDGMPHNFHVHDVQFRVLEVNGERPPPELRGAKDTVFVPGGTTVKLAMRFEGPADPDTPYMYHCHLLYHEDGGMMGQFVVVEKGQRAGKPAAHAGGHSH